MASQQHHAEKGVFPSYQDRQLPTIAGNTALAVLPSLPMGRLLGPSWEDPNRAKA